MAQHLPPNPSGEPSRLTPAPRDDTAPTPAPPIHTTSWDGPGAARKAARAHPAPSPALPKYMFRRGRMLYFKRKVPVDVLDGFPEQQGGQVWLSLGTDLVEQAKVLLAVEVTEFELRVAELRRRKALQAATRAAALGQTPMQRSLHGVSRPLAQGASENHGLSDVGRRMQHDDTMAHLNPAPAVDADAPRVARGPRPMPRTATTRTEPGVASTRVAHRARVLEPNALASPRAGAVNAVVRPTMLHLFEDWKRKQTRLRTINAVRTVVLEFRAMHGALPVEEVTKAHARAYRDFLIERRLSRLTVENRLGFLATLVRHGMRELVEGLAINPFEGIDVSGAQGERTPKDRRAYSIAELNHLYASALYTRGYRPRGQAVDAAYWLPLLGPFVGARIEELCQLRIEDVQRINGVWCIRICDLDESQRVKTASSFRRVPLHEVVIQAGFLAYVAQVARAGHERVFPTLSNDNAHGIYSNAVGKWYGRYLDSIGLTDHRLDYHSFRYLMRQQCSLCGIDNEVRDALTGHWLSNSDAGRTYLKAENRQYPFPKLVAAIRQLRYDELKVSHLFVAEPMAGVEQALLP